jgi:3-dehydroquinate synthase
MNVSYESKIDISFENIFSFIKNSGSNKKVIFIDPIVLANNPIFLEIETNDHNLFLIPTNIYENTKEIESVISILKILEDKGIGRRNDMIYAIGGGALLDTVSLATSIFRRGIFIIKVPTTLLGIVDAAIGIKTGVNFEGQRNRVGSYHFDFKVVIDPFLLKGVNPGLIRQGLGEIFKIAVIKSNKLFEKLEDCSRELEITKFYSDPRGLEIINNSIELMLEELHDNPRETVLKRCVDFGHSFCPLVEMESIKRPGIKTIPHGYAVAYDCLLTSKISYIRKLLSEKDFLKIYNLYNKFDFNFENEIYQDINLLWASFLELTKHRGGSQNLPVPTAVGKYTFLQDLKFEELETANTLIQKSLRK